MTTEHKFKIAESVVIKGLELSGIVREIRLNLHGTQYLLTYWADGKLHEVFLWENELETVN